MLAGAPAFVDGYEEPINAVISRIANAPVPDLRRRGVPDGVCSVVETAMAKNAAARPKSAAALAKLLTAALDPEWTLPVAVAPAPVVVVEPEPEPVAVVNRSPSRSQSPSRSRLERAGARARARCAHRI